MNVNKVCLMGRLTQDPEVRQSTAGGKSYSRVSVAVNRPKAKDAAESVCDFVDCVAFGQTAEFLGKYFRKGNAIIIFGTLRTATRQIGDKKVKTTDVFVEELQFGQSRAESAQTADKPAAKEKKVDEIAPSGGESKKKAGAKVSGAKEKAAKENEEYLSDLTAADDDLPF